MTTLSDRKRRSAVLHPRPRKSASRRTAAKASVHKTEKRTKVMICIVVSGRGVTSAVIGKVPNMIQVASTSPSVGLCDNDRHSQAGAGGVLPGKQSFQCRCLS